MFERFSHKMQARSVALLDSIEGGLDRIMQYWLLVAGIAVIARIAFRPGAFIGLEGVLPYVLVLLAPFASMVLALRWFARGDTMPQPAIRLARTGKWTQLSHAEASRHRLYGASGIMVSLTVGILLNVPIRAGEFLVSMPPLTLGSPEWASTLHALMTFDVVLLTSLYTIAFVAALRRVPFFPRLLAGIWIVDLAMQLVIAGIVGRAGLPPPVATALGDILDGNIKKVLISVALWLPYLLLSARVNVTYRHRVATDA
ncbi:MAG TPA: DUF2569 domain-containing protein [Sphingomicrobium sp.]